MRNTKLIVALDVSTLEAAYDIVERAGDEVQWYKVGKQLFTRFGPPVIQGLKDRGKKVFLDMKFHDIPNTVEQAVRSAAAIGADIINVHAFGGPAMLKAAAKAAEDTGATVIAVTVLTSMDEVELKAVGISCSPAEQVVRLAKLTHDAGLAGVVCSAREIQLIQQNCGREFLTVVPGIRPAGSAVGDQKRVMTPREAALAGAHFIVCGRPVLKAADPRKAAAAINAEMEL
ncbi:MAG: orotidine-5'-phosphate decarboxylase [Lentisphaeria bacterium]